MPSSIKVQFLFVNKAINSVVVLYFHKIFRYESRALAREGLKCPSILIIVLMGCKIRLRIRHSLLTMTIMQCLENIVSELLINIFEFEAKTGILEFSYASK